MDVQGRSVSSWSKGSAVLGSSLQDSSFLSLALMAREVGRTGEADAAAAQGATFRRRGRGRGRGRRSS
jgi:hypothetical protein